MILKSKIKKLSALCGALLLCCIGLMMIGIPAQATMGDDTRAALSRAVTFYRTQSLPLQGGYVWWYSLDGTQRAGENYGGPLEIWIQPPGTPTVGLAYTEAYEATRDPQYLDAAQETADALVTTQLASGGWDARCTLGSNNWYYRSQMGTLTPEQIAGRSNLTYFDDNTSQAALQFLIHLVAASPNDNSERAARIRSMLDYGLSGMMRAQYPNGAWPQLFDDAPRIPNKFPVIAVHTPADWSRTRPPGLPYHFYYSINDNVSAHCIRTMLMAHQLLGRNDCLASAVKGGKFLLMAQLPGTQPGWAQQYNFQMEPAWARLYEPPSVSTRETAETMRVLCELWLATGDEAYMRSVTKAEEWMRRSQMGTNRWSRFYELNTNRPLFITVGNKLSYKEANLLPGYVLVGDFGSGVLAFVDRLQREGREGYLAKVNQPLTPQDVGRAVPPILAAQDAQGRWITNGRIESQTFYNNVHAMARYIKAGG